MTKTELDKRLTYMADLGRFLRNGSGAIAGTVRPSGHRQIAIGGKTYLEHRLAWLHVHGEWPKQQIDHINGIRDDNRIENLRDVPQRVNSQNKRGAHSDSSTGFLGVTQNAGRYAARIGVGRRKMVYLGRFDTPEAAHEAYVQAKRQFHAGNTL